MIPDNQTMYDDLEKMLKRYIPDELSYPVFVCDGDPNTHNSPIVYVGYVGYECPVCRDMKKRNTDFRMEVRKLKARISLLNNNNDLTMDTMKDLMAKEKNLLKAVDNYVEFKNKVIRLFPELGV